VVTFTNEVNNARSTTRERIFSEGCMNLIIVGHRPSCQRESAG
jgi:hypothetical protein